MSNDDCSAIPEELEKKERELIDAARSDQKDPKTVFNLGVVSYEIADSLRRRGRYEEAMDRLETAVASFERAIEINPRDPHGSPVRIASVRLDSRIRPSKNGNPSVLNMAV